MGTLEDIVTTLIWLVNSILEIPVNLVNTIISMGGSLLNDLISWINIQFTNNFGGLIGVLLTAFSSLYNIVIFFLTTVMSIASFLLFLIPLLFMFAYSMIIHINYLFYIISDIILAKAIMRRGFMPKIKSIFYDIKFVFMLLINTPSYISQLMNTAIRTINTFINVMKLTYSILADLIKEFIKIIKSITPHFPE